MDLTTLKSSTLKLYLVLIAQRDQTGYCRLSQRRLSQQAGLARNTLSRALDQLESRSLVTSHPTGWTVDLAPLTALMEQPALAEGGSKIEPVLLGGSKIEPVTPPSGSKIGPPAPSTGSKIEPVVPLSGSKTEPPDAHVRSSNACARTPSTSSSEEVTTLPSFKAGRKEKLAVPEGDPAKGEFAAQFAVYWQDLAPGNALPSQQQLQALQKDVGPDLVLTVARYFLMAGRRLSGIKNPDKAWNYFCRACQSEARTGKLLAQPSPTETSPPPATPTRSMVEIYLQKRSCA